LTQLQGLPVVTVRPFFRHSRLLFASTPSLHVLDGLGALDQLMRCRSALTAILRRDGGWSTTGHIPEETVVKQKTDEND